jgi:hypothetical protein
MVRHKLNVLRDHCQSLSRPYEDIEKTTLGSFRITRDGRDNSTTPDAFLALLRQQASMGVDQAIFSLQNVQDLEPFDLIANQIYPEAEKIEVAGR